MYIIECRRDRKLRSITVASIQHNTTQHNNKATTCCCRAEQTRAEQHKHVSTYTLAQEHEQANQHESCVRVVRHPDPLHAHAVTHRYRHAQSCNLRTHPCFKSI